MKRIEDLWKEAGVRQPLSLQPAHGAPVRPGEKHRVNILALGDVGRTVLLGLKLLGGDVISSIGICDLSAENLQRLEMEMNQIAYPFTEAAGVMEEDESKEKRAAEEQSAGKDAGCSIDAACARKSCSGGMLPSVEIIEETQLFDCDVFVFCASKGVPPLGSQGDVRMAQLEANRELISRYGKMAAEAEFKGLAAVVSDPVDPLCGAFLDASGLAPSQVQGYGLGVMNARALYYAGKDQRFSHFAKEGRAFGPHGADLVIADSIENYNDQLSKELTALAVGANVKVRDLGFKPYIAPAISSAALSILLTLRGQWHYSSLYLGDENTGAFLGMKNRMTEAGPVYEDLPLPEALYARIKNAYENLRTLR